MGVKIRARVELKLDDSSEYKIQIKDTFFIIKLIVVLV